MEEELPCDNSGRCEAHPDSEGISNCIYCGKELIEKDGWWYTWDSDLVKDPDPQGPVLKKLYRKA